MPPTTINVPSVIPTEILAYKNPPPPYLVHFISWLSSLFLLLSVFSLSFGRDLIVLVVVFNILKGM